MREPLVAGNWKMNGSRESIVALMSGMLDEGPFDCEVAVFPPHVFLEMVKRLIGEGAIRLGAQNADWHESGAYTGETSMAMLSDMGCRYCLIGHSERRTLYGETDDVVAAKFAACLAASLTPVLCVGETLAERDDDRTVHVVERQLKAVIDESGIAGIGKAVIAYEPVWAIGTGRSATPGEAEEVHAEIRAILAGYSARISEETLILYGGSVNGENARGLLAMDNIDGALVGGASLKAAEFATICKAAA